MTSARSRRRCRSIVCTALALLVSGAAALPLEVAGATAVPVSQAPLTSLPAVSGGSRPGPPMLYAPPPRAPQLENRAPAFHAAPLLVSGREAYVGGEYLYQDFLNDDHGADTNDGGSGAQSAAVGDLTYPTDTAQYGDNAADLVELRISPQPDAVWYRFTLNTLRKADAAIISVSFDTDRNATTGSSTLPRDPGAPFPGTDAVLTTWGTGAEWSSIGSSAPRTTTVRSTVDLAAAQITVVVPRSVAAPRGIWRMTTAVGLHDRASGGWLRPQEQASATQPGGAGRGGTTGGIFNVAPRFDEPVLATDTPPDEAQARALAAGTPTTFAHDLSFDLLSSRTTRDAGPAVGTMVRIFPSRLQLGGGRAPAFPQFRQQLQSYSLRVPPIVNSGRLAGLTLYFHALNEYHWSNNGNPWLKSVGDARDTLLATPLNRGPDGWYQGPAEADAFEVWSDIATHYRVDPAFVSLMGTSMGGYGAYRFATLYPDLFARVVTNVGPPAEGIWVPGVPASVPPETLTNNWLENVRNVPFFNIAASTDELVPLPGPRAQNLGAPEQDIRGFEQLDYRYRFRVYAPADHIVLSIYSDQAVPDFLARAKVDRNPFHVSFRYVPASDDRPLGLVHDHAYWVSGVRVRGDGVPVPGGKAAAAMGAVPASTLVDAVSDAHGLADPTSGPTYDAGVGGGPPIAGAVQIAYTEVGRTWSAPKRVAPVNQLRLALAGTAAVAVDVRRARLDLRRAATVRVTSDGPVAVTLTGLSPDVVVTGGAVERSDGAAVVRLDASGVIRLSPGGTDAVVPTAGGDSLPATGAGASTAAVAALLMVLAGLVATRFRLRQP